MLSGIFLVFGTLTDVTLLHAEKKVCLQKELSKDLCNISVSPKNSYMLHF